VSSDAAIPAELEQQILAAVDRTRKSDRWYTLDEVCLELGMDLETLRTLISRVNANPQPPQ
jgi:hypothetical protein